MHVFPSPPLAKPVFAPDDSIVDDLTPCVNAATLVLAGGKGTRLQQLTANESKPALSFAGSNRIIDFTMANCARSGLQRLLVATQYAPDSLHRHLPSRWGCQFDAKGLQIRDGRNRYRGTADAARRCWSQITAMGGSQVMILSADHIYEMDYCALLAAHRASGAAVTVAVDTVPRAQASAFGVIEANAEGRILSFEEKPDDPSGLVDRPDLSLISTGIYVFDRQWLQSVLFDHGGAALDFGRDVIPAAVVLGQAEAWHLQAGPSGATYWRDVGTLDALRLAHLDFVKTPPVRLPSACPVGDWYLGQNSVAMAGARVPTTARLRNTLVGPDARIPEGLVTGDDPAEDARWFTTTRIGTILITQDMLDRRAAHYRT